jgi:aldehyde dehydrogenase (NAD+)
VRSTSRSRSGPWNATLALVCGNPVIWKPSEKTPLTALACQALFDRVLKNFSDAPAGLSQWSSVAAMPAKPWSTTRVSRWSAPPAAPAWAVKPKVAARFARSILELGGNNAMILGPSADLDMAVRAILFSAVGTPASVAPRCVA